MDFWALLNLLLTAFNTFVIYLMARQITLILRRIEGRRSTPRESGPPIGADVGHLVNDLHTGELRNRFQLLFFLSKHCGLCAPIREVALALYPTWQGQTAFTFIFEEGEEPLDPNPTGSGIPVVGVPHAGEKWKLMGVPFAILLDRGFRVLGKSVVNQPSDVEQLLALVPSE